MGISLWRVATVLLSSIFVFAVADVVQSNFLSRKTNNDKTYSLQYDLTGEGSADSSNQFPHTKPFHEIYSLKGKDGEIQRIHYATDNKGLRANFHSNAVQLPQNFFPLAQQALFPWFSDSDAEKATNFNNPLRYPSNSVPKNRVENENFKIRQTWVNALPTTEEFGSRLKESQEKLLLSKNEFSNSDIITRQDTINAVGRHQPMISVSYEQNPQVIDSIGQYQPISQTINSVGHYQSVPQAIDSIGQYHPIPQAVDYHGQYQPITQSINSIGQYQTTVSDFYAQNSQSGDSGGQSQSISDVNRSNTAMPNKDHKEKTSNEFKYKPSSGIPDLNFKSSRLYESPVVYKKAIRDILRIPKIPEMTLTKTNENSLDVKNMANTVEEYSPYGQTTVSTTYKNIANGSLNISSNSYQNVKSYNKPDNSENKGFSADISRQASIPFSQVKSGQEDNSHVFFQIPSSETKLTGKDKTFLPKMGKTDLKSKMYLPMSTVFDISNENGHFYHYILNFGKPQENYFNEKNKYYSTGNALLTLLNETGMSYLEKDVQMRELPSIQKDDPVSATSKSIAMKSGKNNYINNPIPSPKSVIRMTENVLQKWVNKKLKDALNKKVPNTSNETETKVSNNSHSTSTDYNLEIKLATTSSPAGLQSESSISTILDELTNNTETEIPTPTTTKSQQIPILKNETEDIERFPLFITIPKLSLDMISVPENPTNSTSLDANGTVDGAEVTTNFPAEKETKGTVDGTEVTTTFPADKETKGVEESTTMLSITTDLSKNDTKDNYSETVQTTTTRNFPTTTYSSSTKGATAANADKIDTTTEVSTEGTFIESTINLNATLTPLFNATDIFVIRDENNVTALLFNRKSNDTNTAPLMVVTPNPKEKNLTVEKYNESIIALSNQVPNVTGPLMVIQVTNMTALMSRIDDLPFKLVDLIIDPIDMASKVTENDTYPFFNSEELHKNSTSNKIFSGTIKQSQLPASTLIQIPPLKVSEHRDVNDVVQAVDERIYTATFPQDIYSLLYPILVEGNVENFIPITQSEAQNTLHVPITSSMRNHYAMNSQPRVVEDLRTPEFTMKQNELNGFLQNPVTSDQLQYTLIQPDKSVHVNENNKMETTFDDSVYGYDAESNQNQEFYGLTDRFSPDINNNNETFALFQPYSGNRYPDGTNADRFNEMLSSEDSRLPEESYIGEQVITDSGRMISNVQESSDVIYERPLTNFPNKVNPVVPEIVVEYIPADTLINNQPTNDPSDGYKSPFIQDSVIILDDYQDSSYNLVNNDGNFIDGTSFSDNTYSASYPNNEIPLQNPDSSIKFGIRVNPSPTAGDEYYSSTDSTYDRYNVNDNDKNPNFGTRLV